MHFDYFFWVVALGTMILGAISAVVGTTMVLQQQSQLGDALGHAVYPGIILAFMVSGSRVPYILLIGALAMGGVAFALIRWIQTKSHFAMESILALVLSSFFGFGMVLSSYIQGNAKFANAAQAGLKRYIMGQAAYLLEDDILLIAAVSLVVLILFIIYYRKISLVLFDKVFAQAMGISVKFIQSLCLILCLVMISVGLKIVGAILISSMLVAPAVAAQQWHRSFPKVLITSAFIGMFSAITGTYISTAVPNIATGPSIVLILSIIAFLSILIGPYGIIQSRQQQEVTK